MRGYHVAFEIGDESAPVLAVVLDHAALNDRFQVGRLRTLGRRWLAKEDRREQELPLQNSLKIQLTPQLGRVRCPQSFQASITRVRIVMSLSSFYKVEFGCVPLRSSIGSGREHFY